MKFVANGPVFVLLYIIGMIPTYLLPYVGSNSSVAGGLAAATESGVLPATIFHLVALGLLVFVTWLRGTHINKTWIVIFPVLASVFDFVPGLSMIPLVPTVMHLLAMILGVSGAKAHDAKVS